MMRREISPRLAIRIEENMNSTLECVARSGKPGFGVFEIAGARISAAILAESQDSVGALGAMEIRS